MAQRDYVSRDRSNTRRKTNRNTKRKANGNIRLILFVTIIVVIAFVSVLYFLNHQHHHATPITHKQKSTQQQLPPKPQTKWSYVKELENRPVGVVDPQPPSTSDTVNVQTPLTVEQRQLLTQMQTDMQQKPVQLPEYQSQPAPITDLIANQQKTNQIQDTPTTKQPISSHNTDKPTTLMIQCGSFQQREQAEVVKATLALSGFESHVRTNNNHYQVMLGKYQNQQAVQKMLQQLKRVSQVQCTVLNNAG